MTKGSFLNENFNVDKNKCSKRIIIQNKWKGKKQRKLFSHKSNAIEWTTEQKKNDEKNSKYKSTKLYETEIIIGLYVILLIVFSTQFKGFLFSSALVSINVYTCTHTKM